VTVTAPPRPNDPIEFQMLEPEPEDAAEALIKEARERARRRRRMYGAVVALVALVGVAVAVFGLKAQSHPTLASRPFDAGASAAFKNSVRIDLNGREFTITGAINDFGTYVDADTYAIDRTLRGRAGTIHIAVDQQAYWEIIEGTGAYAGLHGRGQEGGLYTIHTTDLTMCGIVSGAPIRLNRAEVLRLTGPCTPRYPSLG
jgi:hypothetical protein